jgi:aminoglycoside phosphotransferase (APT) family kinase protein
VLEGEITLRLVADLVAEQFPEWADLPVSPVALAGWDNATFRLGHELSVRLPRHARYASQSEKEQRWLPLLRRTLPFPIPEQVAVGRPSATFPRSWSVYRWIEGEPATTDGVPDRNVFGADLATFLRALHTADAGDGPAPGAHSFWRGGPLTIYGAETRDSIAALAHRLEASAAREVWESAVCTSREGPPVWVHGDITPSNILVRDGRIDAVIDFGCCAVGDPSCDLAIAWTFLDGDAQAVFRHALPLDEGTWSRGRAWALWKAIITVLDDQHRGLGQDGAVSAQRFGWSASAWGVVERVLADRARPQVG